MVIHSPSLPSGSYLVARAKLCITPLCLPSRSFPAHREWNPKPSAGLLIVFLTQCSLLFHTHPSSAISAFVLLTRFVSRHHPFRTQLLVFFHQNAFPEKHRCPLALQPRLYPKPTSQDGLPWPSFKNSVFCCFHDIAFDTAFFIKKRGLFGLCGSEDREV